jgi:nascent polypeptide-associated complex subunit alpha
MFPGMNMNNKQMQQAMKKLGMKQEEIDASKVIIKIPEGDLVFNAPNVTNMNIAGQESFQITGDYEFHPLNTTPDISEEDIKTVVDQTGCSEDEAKIAITNHKGDLAEAILELSNNE